MRGSPEKSPLYPTRAWFRRPGDDEKHTRERFRDQALTWQRWHGGVDDDLGTPDLLPNRLIGNPYFRSTGPRWAPDLER